MNDNAFTNIIYFFFSGAHESKQVQKRRECGTMVRMDYY